MSFHPISAISKSSLVATTTAQYLSATKSPSCSPDCSHANSGAALPSESLLRGQKTVGILHNGCLYKLQATKLGKLILTK